MAGEALLGNCRGFGSLGATMKYLLIISLPLVVIFFSGCGEVRVREASERPRQQVKKAEEQLEMAEALRQAGKAGGKPADRKIIYTGSVALIADDFDNSESRLLELVREHEGYLAESDIHNQPGAPRSGTW